MTQEEIDEKLDAAFSHGYDAAWRAMLSECARHLSFSLDDAEQKYIHLLQERSSAIAALRDVCEEHGDNDWPDDLWLSDIIEKHLHRVLNEERANDDTR